jgi:hypothetical protein
MEGSLYYADHPGAQPRVVIPLEGLQARRVTSGPLWDPRYHCFELLPAAGAAAAVRSLKVLPSGQGVERAQPRWLFAANSLEVRCSCRLG